MLMISDEAKRGQFSQNLQPRQVKFMCDQKAKKKKKKLTIYFIPDINPINILLKNNGHFFPLLTLFFAVVVIYFLFLLT